MSSDALLYTLTGHRGCIWAVAITADGTRAISGSEDTTLKVWDLEHGKELASLAGHSAPVRAVAITPDSKYAISCSDDATVKMWDLERGKELVTLSGHSGTVWSVAITPDGRHAISGSNDETLKVWDLENGRHSRTLTHGSLALAVAVAVTPDGKRVVAGARYGTAKLWELASGEILVTHAGHGSIQKLMILPRNSGLVSRLKWQIWEPESAPNITILLDGEEELAVTPDGGCMVVAGVMLEVWNLKDERVRVVHTGHMGMVRAVAVAPDGRRAVTGASDSTLRVWDLERIIPSEPPRSLGSPWTTVHSRPRPSPIPDEVSDADRAQPMAVRGWPSIPDDMSDEDMARLTLPLGMPTSQGDLRAVPVAASAPRSVDAGAPSEPVRLGASAPRRVWPGQEFTARLAAYNLALLRQARKALRQHGARTQAHLADTSWQTGVKVRVILTGNHLAVNPPAQEFVWQGKLHTVDFDVCVRGDIEEDTDTRLKFGVFLVDVPGCELVLVARVRLDLEIRRKRDWLGRPRPARVQFAARPAFHTAYASYHAADWANVLTRLDAIQQLTGMKFFHECLSLDPSPVRKYIVTTKIEEQGLFMLFWSRRAADSREVEFEWRTALERKGLEAMQAQRLEPEPLLPPELEPLDRTAGGQNLAALGTALAARVVPQKSKIVFLAANPVPGEHRALDEEAREIAAKIRAAAHRDALAFETRWAVRPDDLLQVFNEDRPAVMHFSGYGTGELGIVLHDDAGAMKLVPAAPLQRLFTLFRHDIRLVVFNACYSHEQALAVTEVIDCVIGMSDRIGDYAARTFAASFYRALGFGRSVRNAFDQGLAAIALEGLEAEHVPRLLTRAGVDADHVYIVAAPGTAPREPMSTGARAEH